MECGRGTGGRGSVWRQGVPVPVGTAYAVRPNADAGPAWFGPRGGHCFPGRADHGGLAGQVCGFGCVAPAGFDWGLEVMKFFVAHPKK